MNAPWLEMKQKHLTAASYVISPVSCCEAAPAADMVEIGISLPQPRPLHPNPRTEGKCMLGILPGAAAEIMDVGTEKR